MLINGGNLRTLTVAFNAAFRGGLGSVPPAYQRIASVVPSTTGSEEYGWLGKIPNVREWLGDRVINGIQNHGYSIKNKPYELTVGVPRAAIEDDQYGIYTPLMTSMGESMSAHPDQLVFPLLKAGSSTPCYDGQYFFDTDHPVLDAAGNPSTQSNWDNNAGAGVAWYLLSTKRAIKPVIFQERKKPNFVSKTGETDDNVFDRAEYVWGSDARYNVGFGFWQMAYGSRKDLTEDNLVAAYTAFTERTGDHGRPLGIVPDLLVVRPSQKFVAAKILSASTLANGADNVMKGLVDVLDTAYLI